MNPLRAWTLVIVLGAGIAAYNLFTGWTVAGGVAAWVVVLGLFLGAFALFGAMLMGVLKERKQLLAAAPDARAVLAGTARAIRWSGAFTIAFCMLLFANCSGGIGDPNTHLNGAMMAPRDFTVFTAWVLTPLLLALLLPPLMATAAQLFAERHPELARRFAGLIVWGCALAAGAAVATVPAAFFLGVSSCDVGPSAGYCAAGVGGLLNIFSLGSLALFLPCVSLVTWALARMEYDRANPT